MNIDIDAICELARTAGAAIMDVYRSDDFAIEHKDDDSPLTKADRVSHELIKAGLSALAPTIPLISEEGKEVAYEERQAWQRFWLVDPLDGTKEFIKRNGEFTVNIALVESNRPIAGVIYAPVWDALYFTGRDGRAYKSEGRAEARPLQTNTSFGEGIIALKSRSHAGSGEGEFFGRHKVKESFGVGSSLKFCLIAEGRADMYYRHGPTWEWDSAAGQAILQAAGGIVLEGDHRLHYNKATLKNDNGFLCLASDTLRD